MWVCQSPKIILHSFKEAPHKPRHKFKNFMASGHSSATLHILDGSGLGGFRGTEGNGSPGTGTVEEMELTSMSRPASILQHKTALTKSEQLISGRPCRDGP